MKLILSIFLASVGLAQNNAQALLIARPQSTAGASTFAFVQGGSCQGSGLTCTITISPSNGNLVVVVGYTGSSNLTLAASDSATNIYSNACGFFSETMSSRSMELFYVIAAGGITTITITRGMSNGNIEAWAGEYSATSGFPASPLDQCATGQNQSVTSYVTSNTSATTNARDLQFAAAYTNTGTFTAGASWTLRTNFDVSHLAEDILRTSTGAYAGAATQSASGFGPMVTSLFKLN